MPLADRWQLDGRERRRGEFQNLGPRRDVEHDAAPVAVEAGEDGTQIVLGSCAPELHRQAAERAVRVRGVGIHVPSHRLVWLIEGKRRACRRLHRRLNILGSAIAGGLNRAVLHPQICEAVRVDGLFF